jgi:hypothetical protein
MEEKIQKRETEDQSTEGKESWREIHRGEKKGGKKEMDSGERHWSIDREKKETQGKRHRGEIERRGRVER